MPIFIGIRRRRQHFPAAPFAGGTQRRAESASFRSPVPPPDKEIIAGGVFCYDKCDSLDDSTTTFSRYGYDCHQNCKEGWIDHGLLCYKADGLKSCGVGTIECGWELKDGWFWALSCGGSHCGDKEDCAGLCYDDCPADYNTVGCPLCSVDCKASGYEGGVAPSCTKHIRISPGLSPATCAEGEAYDAGLCYPPCPKGFESGVGPVCWSGAPTVEGKQWVNCGMGAAVDEYSCGWIIFDQVMGPIEVAFYFGSLGSSSAATAALKTGKKVAAAGANAVKKAGSTVKVIKETGEKLYAVFSHVKDSYNYLSTANSMISATSEVDSIRAAASVASYVDPTSISSTIAVYGWNKCSFVTDGE